MGAIKYLLAFTAVCFSLVLKAQNVNYTNGNNGWDADSLGNHRAVIKFNGTGPVAKVFIPWRRRDENPEQKRIIVQDAKTGAKILNVKTEEITRESATIYFEPVSGIGTYYVYYLLYKDEGARVYYPKGVYRKPENTASEQWLKNINLETDVPSNCNVTEIQSINAFNSFYPMEVIATVGETATLIAQSKGNKLIVFPENRIHSIRMKNDLPLRWIEKGITKFFSDDVKRGENYSFQLGVYALEDIKNIQVKFSDFKSEKGNIISGKLASCLNTDGIRFDGTAFNAKVDMLKGKIQAMWCLVDIPENAKPGVYKGIATVTAEGGAAWNTAVILNVKNELAKEGGINEPEKMTRLKWMNSTIASDNMIIAPYIPLKVEKNNISLLGRKLIIGNDGLPADIQTFFTKEMTSVTNVPLSILSKPLHFNIKNTAGNAIINWQHSKLIFTKKDEGLVSWQVNNTSADLQLLVDASIEFDGFISYKVKVIALKDIALKTISLQMPFNPEVPKYFMGLGLKGGYRPDSIKWVWDVANKNQDGAWLGDVNAGIHFSLRDEKYSRPLNTNFYLQKPLLLPASWGNKGGINLYKEDNAVMLNAFSGERNMKKGDVLNYNFTLLITPFHTINTNFQWQAKFYHKYNNIDTIKNTGAKIINIHHATPINPFINYPFIEHKKMKDYIDKAHTKGLKVKIYNTIRELSNSAYELHALRSLGYEIFSTGKGGGFSWLQEHVGDDYLGAWFVPELKDAAIVNSGMSRWHNYYVEGMNWLVQKVGIDGVYLDDVAFDRVTMKRIKRVLTKDNHPGILDLHSANQFNKSDGFNNSANLYMEHFPYLNKLWYGEYFDYQKNGPDFFLTEVSGIPFGLMGEMLQDGGNLWRGMIYGMTNRMPWDGGADPTPVWKVWDLFGIENSEMIGYWSPNCPVTTTNNYVLATVYKKDKSVLVSIASWAPENVKVKLNIDWNKLGINPATATITAVEVKNFQPAKFFKPGDEIDVEKNKGWLLIIK